MQDLRPKEAQKSTITVVVKCLRSGG